MDNQVESEVYGLYLKAKKENNCPQHLISRKFEELYRSSCRIVNLDAVPSLFEKLYEESCTNRSKSFMHNNNFERSKNRNRSVCSFVTRKTFSPLPNRALGPSFSPSIAEHNHQQLSDVSYTGFTNLSNNGFRLPQQSIMPSISEATPHRIENLSSAVQAGKKSQNCSIQLTPITTQQRNKRLSFINSMNQSPKIFYANENSSQTKEQTNLSRSAPHSTPLPLSKKDLDQERTKLTAAKAKQVLPSNPQNTPSAPTRRSPRIQNKKGKMDCICSPPKEDDDEHPKMRHKNRSKILSSDDDNLDLSKEPRGEVSEKSRSAKRKCVKSRKPNRQCESSIETEDEADLSLYCRVKASKRKR